MSHHNSQGGYTTHCQMVAHETPQIERSQIQVSIHDAKWMATDELLTLLDTTCRPARHRITEIVNPETGKCLAPFALDTFRFLLWHYYSNVSDAVIFQPFKLIHNERTVKNRNK